MEKFYELLGWKARDRVTGFTGVVASVSVDLYGCVMAVLSPEAVKDKDGIQKLETGHYFDVTRIEKLGTARVMEPVAPRYPLPPGPADKPAPNF